MKYIFTLFLFATFSFANYSIKYNGIELGEMKNLDTLKDNYIEAQVSNSIAKFILGRDFVILFNENFNLRKDKNKYLYKKEKSQIITILQKAYDGTLKTGIHKIDNNKSIEISFDKHYKFVFKKKDKIKSEGYFIMKNNQLEKLVENVNDIEISKK